MDEFVATDCAIVFPTSSHAIASDIHLSADETPAETIDRLTTLIQSHSVETLVLNGDTFNEFPFNSQFLEWTQNAPCEVIIVDGNHEDQVGGFIGTESTQKYVFTHNNKTVCVTHGHHNIDTDGVDILIIGHLHPTTDETDIPQPCLLQVELDYTVLILPSFRRTENIPLETEASPIFTHEQFATSPVEIVEVFNWD